MASVAVATPAATVFAHRATTRWVALLALAIAFGFLGSRGIWDPDEGRYTNVALNMLDSGDWLDPHRNADIGHWTKPPVTYWAIAASVAAFGQNPFAARLPVALAFLCCTWLAWRTARRLAPGTEDMAAIGFATMLVPFAASGVITTDFLLAAFQVMAVHAFVEARFGPADRAHRWMLLMWAAYAAAFMTKGPPALLPLLATVAFDLLVPRQPRRRWAAAVPGIAVFLALALPWFAAVAARHDGLLGYFLGREVVDRVGGGGFDRNGEWYGWLKVYGPTLALGTLPWTPALWRWSRGLPARLADWRSPAARTRDAGELLLVLWVALPLLVLCLASSRLPLYVLPLFVPLAVVAALQRQREGRPPSGLPWLAVWVALLLCLRLAAAALPTHKDASAWADAIRARSPATPTEVIFVDDMARYGLHLHLDVEIEKVSVGATPPTSRFNPVYDESLEQELAEAAREAGAVYVVKAEAWPGVRARITSLGYVARPLGTPYQGRVLFSVRPGPASALPIRA